jgi:hypothetical protein
MMNYVASLPLTSNHVKDYYLCMVTQKLPVLYILRKNHTAEEPSYVQRIPLSYVFEIGLKSN